MQGHSIVPQNTLSLREYLGTAPGKALLAARRVFVYGGFLWGSCMGRPARIHWYQLEEEELELALDIDGSKERMIQLIQSETDDYEDRVRDEKAQHKLIALNKRKDLVTAIAEQTKEFGFPDPDLVKALTSLDNRVANRGRPRLVAQEPEPGSPEDLARFQLNPHVHEAVAPAPARAGEVAGLAKTVENLTGMVERLTSLVLANQPGPELDLRPEPTAEEIDAQILADVDATIPQEPAEEAFPPSTHCEPCNKSSPPGHLNPPMWLRGHNMSKHTPRKVKD